MEEERIGFIDWNKLEVIEMINEKIKFKEELIEDIEKSIKILTKLKEDIDNS